MGERLVWYVSYGSNLDRDRLLCYIRGGRPPAARRANVGARDPSPPRDDRPVTIPHGLFFADVSHVWTGGVAFVDHRADPSVRTYARAYLVTTGQLADVIAQESARPIGSIEMDEHLDEVARHGRAVIGPGRYDTVLDTGSIDGRPCLTFTGRAPLVDTDLAVPAGSYLAMIGAGLHRAHGLDPEATVAYLIDRPGVAGHWTEEALREAVTRRRTTPGPDLPS